MNPVLRTTLFIATLLLASIAPGVGQDNPVNGAEGRRYRVVDLGTLGGPNSYLPLLPPYHELVPSASLSKRGTFVGFADTSIPDPYDPSCFVEECLVVHAVAWTNGALVDLGALPGGGSSAATWISNSGRIVGFSENGQIDPLTGFPSAVAVLWDKGKPSNLGTLEGGYQSIAMAVNSFGQVVGVSSDRVPDPNSLLGTGTQARAFLWQNGQMEDLGTLDGASDAMALFVNDRGQIVGQSYTAESIVPPAVGCEDSPLTLYTFFLDKGQMISTGTLGGHCAFPYALNNQGQVVGQANLEGDTESHPFLWQPGRSMRDLGTLGGDYATWINDTGTAVGATTNPGGGALLATLWQDGEIGNLRTLPGDACSVADTINSSGQVVGGSGFNAAPFFPDCTGLVEHAVLWDHGKVVDLNDFVPPGSGITLNEAWFINDEGEISGVATLSNGDQHTFLLVPCGRRSCDAETFAGKHQAGALGLSSARLMTLAQRHVGVAKPVGRGGVHR